TSELAEAEFWRLPLPIDRHTVCQFPINCARISRAFESRGGAPSSNASSQGNALPSVFCTAVAGISAHRHTRVPHNRGGPTIRITIPRFLRPVLLSLAGCGLVLFLARTGSTQPPGKPAAGKTSYDQISPALAGQVSFEEMMAKDKAAKAGIVARQKALLEERYNLAAHPHESIKMTRGKPIPVGPTAKLREGMTFEKLAEMSADEIRAEALSPKGSLPLPPPTHAAGGMLSPQQQIKQFARLERFDLDFDIPEQFLPEFPPAIFLITRPDLGDVSQGKVVTIENFQEIFRGILNSKDLDGLRLLLTQFPQQQFNATADRKTNHPQGMQGVACFDCHLNGHKSAATPLVGDIRPQEHRRRIDTPSLRGVNIQRLFGSQRSLK